MVKAGLKAGHRVANLFYAGHLYGGFLYIEASLHNAPVENVRLPVGGHVPDEEVAELIASFGVNVLAGTPMKLAGVAEAVLDAGSDADSVELLMFAGDLLFDDVRPLLHKAFPLAEIASLGYASVDAGIVGAPVPGDDVRVHEAVPDRTIVEILDEATEEPITVPGVRGRVVVTNLFRTLMPIIRYPVGDLAEWVDDECRAFRLVGRTHEGARVANVAMAYVDVHAALLAADRDRRDHRDADGRAHGGTARTACCSASPRSSEPPAGLTREPGRGGVPLPAAVPGHRRRRPHPPTAGRVGPARRPGHPRPHRQARAGRRRAPP